jgi:hypothetical protein
MSHPPAPPGSAAAVSLAALATAEEERLRAKWAPFAVARDLTDAAVEAPELLQQSTEAERAARRLEASTAPNHEEAARSMLEAAAPSSSSGSSSSIFAPSADQRAAAVRLSRIQICRKCNGLGIVKEVYNHYVRDKTCSQCDGEGIIVPPADGGVVAGAEGESVGGTGVAGAGADAGDGHDRMTSVASIALAAEAAREAGEDEPPPLEDA